MDNLVEPVLPSTFKLVAEIISLWETSTSTMSISPALEDAEFCIGVLCHADLAAATTVADTQLAYVTFLSKSRHKMASPGVIQQAGNFSLLHLSFKTIASSL